MEAVNRDLSKEGEVAGSQIKRFLVLHKELDADDGELTRTAKVRRGTITERYKPLIDALYEPQTTRQKIRTEVTFEDGKTGVTEAEVEIRDVEMFAYDEGVLKEAAE